MGNFSISHYARIELAAGSSHLTYVLDFAEIPTFELLQAWKIDARDSLAIQVNGARQAKDWLQHLLITSDGQTVSPRFEAVRPVIQNGAGGMPVLRVAIAAALPLPPGTLHYEDRNYPSRTGWKEVVVRCEKGAKVVSGAYPNNDLSGELTAYPTDVSVVPPQVVSASLRWAAGASPISTQAALPFPARPSTGAPATAPAKQPGDIAKPFTAQQPTASGTVIKGDFLSRVLRQPAIGLWTILLGLAVAFGLGAMHALSPGHGKTVVAAYLVGSRGTLKHALLLGATVTATHTSTVFLLGLGVFFFEQYVVPERITSWLGAVSGLSIVTVGVLLLYQRAKVLLSAGHIQEHHHHHAVDHAHTHHSHEHLHDHDHHHDHDHPHTHSHGTHVHSHGGHAHSHVPEGDITLGSLIALGVSGGLVPCPSALVLMLSAIALGHAGLGLILLVGFSAGLAIVLMAIGAAVIYAKNLLPERPSLTQHPFFRLMPVFSAMVVIVLGLGMTALSLGILQPSRIFLSLSI